MEWRRGKKIDPCIIETFDRLLKSPDVRSDIIHSISLQIDLGFKPNLAENFL